MKRSLINYVKKSKADKIFLFFFFHIVISRKGSDGKVCMREKVRTECSLGQILIGFGNKGGRGLAEFVSGI